MKLLDVCVCVCMYVCVLLESGSHYQLDAPRLMFFSPPACVFLSPFGLNQHNREGVKLPPRSRWFLDTGPEQQ